MTNLYTHPIINGIYKRNKNGSFTVLRYSSIFGQPTLANNGLVPITSKAMLKHAISNSVTKRRAKSISDANFYQGVYRCIYGSQSF